MTTTHHMKAAVKGVIKQGQADGLVGSDEELRKLKDSLTITASDPIRFRKETIGTPYTLQMLGYLHNKYWGRNSHLEDAAVNNLKVTQ